MEGARGGCMPTDMGKAGEHDDVTVDDGPAAKASCRLLGV